MVDAFWTAREVVGALEAIDAVRRGARPEEFEGPVLDFKEEPGRRGPRGQLRAGRKEHEGAAKALADAAACMANAEGGVVVVGVDDKLGGPDALIGTALDGEWLRQRIWSLTSPSLAVDARPREFDGARLLVLRVVPGPQVYISGGQAKQRIGDRCVPMAPSDQRRLEEARSGYDWSSEPSDALVSDVSDLALEVTRGLLRAAADPSRAALAARPTEDLLRALGVLVGQRLTNAGRLLFVESDRVLIDYQRRPAPGASSTDRWEAGGPLVTAYTDVKARLDAVNDEYELHLRSGVRPRIRMVPDRAVREVLVNALMHRDHRRPEPVVVELAERQLVVTSPGGFPTGISPENIISERSHPRNASLARVFRSLRLAEQEGVGVDRVYRDMAAAGLGLPRYADTGGRVRCQLVGGRPLMPLVEFLGGLPMNVQEDVDAVLIVHALLTHPAITPDDVAATVQKPIAEGEEALRRTERHGLVVRTTSSTRTNPRYRLADSVIGALPGILPYATTSAENAEEYVVRHVLETGSIRAGDVRELLQVSSVQASNVLRRLRDEGVLVFGGEATRGRSVFHVSGPMFSAAMRRHGLEPSDAVQ